MRFHRFSAILPMTLGACSVLASLCVLPQPLLAATITVDGQIGDPSGTCDLAEAIDNANSNFNLNADCAGVGPYGDDTIELTADVTLDSVNNVNEGPNGLTVVFSTIEIQGNGFTVRRANTPDDFRIFRVSVAGDLTLQDLTVSGGSQANGGGGAILNLGTVTLINSTLSDNSTSIAGGAIVNIGMLVITNSTLSGNSSALVVGGIGGGAIWNSDSGTLEITHSTLSDNLSFQRWGGGIYNEGTVTLTNVTLVGNSAVHGGGIYNEGTTDVTNSTLSGNSASFGAGVYNDSGTTTLTNATLAGNSAPLGHTIRNNSGTTTLTNSLVARGSSFANCSGTITDGLRNLADDATCGAIPDTLTGLNPTLTDNGGPTMTHALLPGSTAIGLAGGACGTSTDQRGAAREGDCDSGAFEFLTCDDLSFSGDMIGGTETKLNCKKIVADFTVLGTGDLTLRAGTGIELRNGTAVEAGGTATFVIDPQLQVARLVFVTSIDYDGNLGGLTGADGECQALADGVSLPGVFKAWLASDSLGPEDHFVQAAVPYLRVDGVRVADNWTDLTDRALQAPINVTELGVPTPATEAWTNVLANGNEDPDPLRSCPFNWNSDSPMHEGAVGTIQSTTTDWTFRNIRRACNTLHPLYCFQQ